MGGHSSAQPRHSSAQPRRLPGLMRRRLLPILAALICLAAVIAFQISRPATSAGNPRVFVPAPRFYEEFSPSYRTSIADLYWLEAIQYYGEHVNGDHRLDSLPAMLTLVTTLSPHFIEPYLFSSFALIDAHQPLVAYTLLQRGQRANPRNWQLPFQLGFLVYMYGEGKTKDQVAAHWFTVAADLPGRPTFVPRLAADLLAKGGETHAAIIMWAQIYQQGDKIAMQKAAAALNSLLPQAKQARMQAVAALKPIFSPARFNDLIAALFQRYL